ncbi:hypothetical protein ACFQL7_28745 [Halocatena marina]|uniref:Uncharacterized protein n=1 Tax=Halocatena marina TaxID=2934937 RepID=A0ABD5YZA7_9EURY|nr:hypothetical protein [Halocatena marina]
MMEQPTQPERSTLGLEFIFRQGDSHSIGELHLLAPVQTVLTYWQRVLTTHRPPLTITPEVSTHGAN